MNGAWEAGVIYGLVNYGDPKQFQWDVVSGVSAGCINAAGVSLWEKGKEQEMAKWITDFWAMDHSKDIY